jgi:uncharacterized membrane protein YgdD (TMEM256/DUF423 family)
MIRLFICVAAIDGFLSVLLGAFAAHGLSGLLTAKALQLWHTSVQYQMSHVLALLAVAVLLHYQPSKALILAGLAFILGSFLFCSSLYALALGAPAAIGIITPFGGLSFLVGWLALFFAGWQMKRS